MRLLTIDNTKTSKGQQAGYLTGILYLAPANLSGKNLCPYSTPGCRKACLNTAGRGAFSSVQQARLKKTQWLLNDRQIFVVQLHKDIAALIRKAKRKGLNPCVRLNGTSDLRWELIAPDIFATYPDLQFYDYTKYPVDRRKDVPANYHLTYSASESVTALDMQAMLGRSNVAVVVESEAMKQAMLNDTALLSVDGDKNDLRFLDPSHNYFVLLTAKGKAKKDLSGFVIR